MSSHNRKRKHRSGHHHHHYDFEPRREQSPPELHFLGHHDDYQRSLLSNEGTNNEAVDPLRSLYIEAHEADIIHGPHAEAAAQSLEVVEYRSLSAGLVKVIPKTGSALIQWGSSSGSGGHGGQTGHEDDAIPAFGTDLTQSSIWVDRYDIRLLLDTPNFNASDVVHNRPASPSGWSDIPSDAEDTFFFTPDEMEDFHREKRRRLMEKSREERLKARLEEDGVEEKAEEEDIWGGSDEEPDEVEKELMRRTAVHLLSSPNPAQLEMRILANHGGDRRFAFLRGRWGRAWKLAKAKARLEKEKLVLAATESKPAALGVLAGYGSDSDNSDGEESKEESDSKELIPEVLPLPPATTTSDEELAKEARRRRLKQWAEARKAAKDAT